jgi:poly(3-hydroxybutyrate) depolymerase
MRRHVIIAAVGVLLAGAAVVSCQRAAAESPATADVIRDRILMRIDRGRLLRAPQITSATKAPGGGRGYESIIVGGQVRLFQRYTPNAILTAGKPAPTLVVLHPDGRRAHEMPALTGLARLADREGFVVVYPQAADPRWAAGGGGANPDVEFLNRLADSLVAERIADRQALYMVGLGGASDVTMRLACGDADRFAAFAVVTANLGAAVLDRCRAATVRIAVVAGTVLDGVRTSGPPTRPGDPSGLLAQRLGCDEQRRLATAGRLERATWDGCRRGVEVDVIRAVEPVGLDMIGPEVWRFLTRTAP